MEVNRDELYKAAELAYKFFHGDEGLSLDINPNKIRSKLLQLNRGRPAESEFAALALWSGHCKYIHKLDIDTLPGDCTYEVPDFLCFLDVKGKIVPILVEVKTSKNEVLKFTKKYYSALKSFADELGLPVLIAFKFTGFGLPWWALFELQKILTPRGTGKANIREVLRHDLTSTLFGNFHFQIRKGATIAMKISKERIERDDSGSIVSMDGRIEDIYWETPEGKRVEWVSLLDMLFMLSEDDVKIEEYQEHIVQKFYKVSDNMTISYWALPLAVSPSKYLAGETIPWDRTIRNQGFSFLLTDVEEAVERAQKSGLAGPMIFTKPQDMPQFLETI